MDWYRKSSSQYFSYVGDCVSFPAEFTNYVIDRARQISYKTFKRYVPEISEYDNAYVPLAKDYAVSFNKSVSPSGKTIFYMRHSAIEYFFCTPDFDLDQEMRVLKSKISSR